MYATYEAALFAAFRRNRLRRRRTNITILLDPAAGGFTIRNGLPLAGQAVRGEPVAVGMVGSDGFVVQYFGEA